MVETVEYTAADTKRYRLNCRVDFMVKLVYPSCVVVMEGNFDVGGALCDCVSVR